MTDHAMLGRPPRPVALVVPLRSVAFTSSVGFVVPPRSADLLRSIFGWAGRAERARDSAWVIEPVFADGSGAAQAERAHVFDRQLRRPGGFDVTCERGKIERAWDSTWVIEPVFTDAAGHSRRRRRRAEDGGQWR